jgi:F0F1-type ATP synthase membrane subunit b/b'
MNDSNANLAQQACTDQARKQQFSPMVAAYETRDANLSADLDAARKRIAELEASVEEQAALADKWRTLAKRADSYVSDANDAAGTLRTERDDLLRENAVLRRKLEADERKAGKR